VDAGLLHAFLTLVQAHVDHGGEGTLLDAYELGQRVAREQGFVGTVVDAHQDALSALIADRPEDAARIVRAAKDILHEALAPFEHVALELESHQQEQRGLNDRLRQQAIVLDQINEALRKANAQAETADRAKSLFLANMSHEIRTPLNAIIGVTDLLKETRLEDHQHELLEIVSISGVHLLSVINDVLDFSKIESGRLELEHAAFDLRQCVEDALDLIASKAAEKPIELSCWFGDGVPDVAIGDVARLRQVLLNLLSNAVKFTRAGEVSVSVRGEKREDGQVELNFAVKDTGEGIPPERMERLFKPFSQIDASTTRLHGGTGLGLAISHRLIELQGGRCWAESALELGSTFHFSIVVGEAPTDPARTRALDLVRKKRVLVVEACAATRSFFERLAATWGLLARVVGSIEEASTLVSNGERFDAILVEQAQFLREGRAWVGSHPVLVHGAVTGEQLDPLRSTPVRAAISKPLKPTRILRALSSALGPQEPDGETASGVNETIPLPDLRVLLAEDNVVNQKVALALLRRLGCAAEVANNGQEALDAIEARTFDVILMDMQMPILDGLRATQHIRERLPAEKQPRVIMLTANATEEDRRISLAAGADDFLAKPVRLAGLSRALARFSSKSSGKAIEGHASRVYDPSAGMAADRRPGTSEVFEHRPGEDEIRCWIAASTEGFRGLRRSVELLDRATARSHARRLREACALLGRDDEFSELREIESMDSDRFAREALSKVLDMQAKQRRLVRSLLATSASG
jgi:signal transduction histidine kinase/CheY-like chemotaxis protein